MKQILIAHEKHGRRYFDASTPELLAENSLKLLKERWEEDWYWLESPPEGKDILSEDQIAALPTEKLRDLANQERNEYLEEVRLWKIEEEEYNSIKHCAEGGAENNFKNRAWKLLYSRRRYEYEKVELETLE